MPTLWPQVLKEAGVGFYRNPPIVKTLFDDQVTADNVEAAFNELAGKVKATDVFLLYMAGHGKTITADGDYYFLPPSMDSFSDAEIKAQGFGPGQIFSWFRTIQAEKSIWIFDTCESGSAWKLFRARDATADDAAYLGSTMPRAALSSWRPARSRSRPKAIAIMGFSPMRWLEGLAKAGVRGQGPAVRPCRLCAEPRSRSEPI